MRHDTSRVWPKILHSCISLVRVSKLIFDHFFANVGSTGPALALEVTNIRWGLKELQGPSLIGDVHELC